MVYKICPLSLREGLADKRATMCLIYKSDGLKNWHQISGISFKLNQYPLKFSNCFNFTFSRLRFSTTLKLLLYYWKTQNIWKIVRFNNSVVKCCRTCTSSLMKPDLPMWDFQLVVKVPRIIRRFNMLGESSC